MVWGTYSVVCHPYTTFGRFSPFGTLQSGWNAYFDIGSIATGQDGFVYIVMNCYPQQGVDREGLAWKNRECTGWVNGDGIDGHGLRR